MRLIIVGTITVALTPSSATARRNNSGSNSAIMRVQPRSNGAVIVDWAPAKKNGRQPKKHWRVWRRIS
jgi:hypothetical protein